MLNKHLLTGKKRIHRLDDQTRLFTWLVRRTSPGERSVAIETMAHIQPRDVQLHSCHRHLLADQDPECPTCEELQSLRCRRRYVDQIRKGFIRHDGHLHFFPGRERFERV